MGLANALDDFKRGCSHMGCLRMVKGLALMGKLSLIFCGCRPSEVVVEVSGTDDEDDVDGKISVFLCAVSCVALSLGLILCGFGGNAGRSLLLELF